MRPGPEAACGWGAATLIVATAWGCMRRPDRPLTFNRDIAKIVFTNCAPCHRPGGAGPFSLLAYADVRKRASQIVEVTTSRYMPPWPPEPGDVKFAGERRLAAEEIARIAAWVGQGAQEGDSADLPRKPVFPSDWPLGTPDAVLEMDEAYALPAEGSDVFRNFVLRAKVEVRRYVRAVDLRPGNPRVVHHANVLIDRTGTARRLDADEPGPGFSGMELLLESNEFEPHSQFLFWKPGTPPTDDGAEMAWPLDARTDLVVNMHLQPSGKPESIKPVIALYFSDRPPTKFPILVQLEDDAALDIPPGERAFTVTDELELPVDADAVGIYPHAHYLGKRVEAWATSPSGGRRSLIRIPDWDFNWQAVYRFAEPVFLPKGTRLTMRFTYDNSAQNPRNRSVPPRRVRAGDRSEDEMAHLWIQLVPRVPPEQSRDARMALHEATMRHRLDKHPGDFEAHFNLGSALQSRGRLAEAVDHFLRALAARPRDATALTSLGAALHQMGRDAEAVERLREALAIRPSYSNARYDLGRALTTLGRRDEAVREFTRLLREDPDDVDVLNNLGYLFATGGQVARAIEMYQRSARLVPGDAETASSLGQLFAMRGDAERARSYFARALELDPGNAEARRRLAAVGVEAEARETK